MPTNPFSRATAFGLLAMLSASLIGPVAVSAETGADGDAPVIAAVPTTPEEFPILVSPDVRWAPERTVAPMSPAEASRIIAAQQALLSTGLGSMQEEALTIVVTTSTAPVAAAPEGPVETLARGTRSESTVLWQSLQPQGMAANSDDRIANALFGASA